MINDEVALWGLTDASSTDEIWNTIFTHLIGMGGRVGITTVKDGWPDSRIISVQRFKDGNVYFMTSRGKPFYKQLVETPRISFATLLDDTHHSLRMKAAVEECTDPAVYKEYADSNPGTMRMYRNNTDLIVLFKLVSGTGEIFHLYRDDMVRRLRFGFGGEVPDTLTYHMTEQCIGCGTCMNNCAEQAIYRTEEGKCQIRGMDCDDCGICYTKCPLAGKALVSKLEDDGQA